MHQWPGMRRSNSVYAAYTGKTVVLCLGNRYMKDDAVGIRVADQLAVNEAHVVIDSCQTADLSLLARYAGARRVVVVDALVSGSRPGTVSRFVIGPRRDPVQSLPGSHSIGLHDMFDFASQSRLLTCPVTIIGIEPRECGPGEGLSPEVEGAIPRVISEIDAELRRA